MTTIEKDRNRRASPRCVQPVDTPSVGWQPFDRFPYTFLTMVVSLEAIFLSTFVLITQDRQSRQSDRREKVDLQVNMIAEREITKVLELIADIHSHLGLDDSQDPDLNEMQEEIRVEQLAEATDSAERSAP